MEANIRNYVESLFVSAPPSRKAVELKEEMIQNLIEKYNDLLTEGKTPEAAYNIAIAGIGDVSGLLQDLERDGVSPEVIAAHREKTALFTAIAVMMYIVSVVPLIALSVLVQTAVATVIGLVFLFVLIAGATGLLIYNHMSKPKYVKMEDTMVEEFRQWQNDNRDRKTLRNSITSAVWSLIVAIYFIVSFTTGAWHISWVIFIIGGAVQSIISIAFTVKK